MDPGENLERLFEDQNEIRRYVGELNADIIQIRNILQEMKDKISKA